MERSATDQSVKAVRKSARSYLAQLRAERLNRNAGTKEASGDVAQAPETTKTARPKVGKRGVRVDVPSDAPESPSADDTDALRARVLAELRDISGQPEPPKPKSTKTAAPKKRTAAAKTQKKAAKPARKAQTTATTKAATPKAAKPKTSATKAIKTPATDKPAAQKAKPSEKASKSGVKAPATKTDAAPTNREMRLKARQDAREAVRKGAEQVRRAAHEAQQKIRAARLAQRAAAAKQRDHLQAAQSKQAKAAAGSANNKTQPQNGRRWTPQRGSAHKLAQATEAPAAAKKAASPPRATPQPKRMAMPPLTALRGIGDAMNRRLEQAGIASLSDLTSLAPHAVRERLGPVSALANVEGWQDEANQLLGLTPSTNRAPTDLSRPSG